MRSSSSKTSISLLLMAAEPPRPSERAVKAALSLQRLADRPTGQVIRDALVDLLPFACLVSLLAIIGTICGMIPGVKDTFDVLTPYLQSALDIQTAASSTSTLDPSVEQQQAWLIQLDLIPYLAPYLAAMMLMPAAFAFTSALRFADRYRLRERIALGMAAMAVALILTWGPALVVPFMPQLAGLQAATLYQGILHWGIVAGLACGWGIVWLHRKLNGAGMSMTLPVTVPEAYVGPYRVLLPATLLFLIATSIVIAGGWTLAPFLTTLSNWLTVAITSLPLLLIAVLLVHALIWLGVQNGSAVVAWFWLAYLTVGMVDLPRYLADVALAPPITLSAILFGVLIGGPGGTLGLNLLLFRSGAVTLRKLGAWALPGSLINVNDLLIYGLPIPYSQPLVVPFFAAPLAMALLTWIAFSYGWVNPPILIFPPFVPAPLGLWMATNDMRSLVLVAANIGLSMAIYAPYLAKYDVAVQQLEAGEDPDTPSYRQPQAGVGRVGL